MGLRHIAGCVRNFLFISPMWVIVLLGTMAPFLAHATGEDEIKRFCKYYKYDDCALVLTLVRGESSFNPNEFNRERENDPELGSYGLMQVRCSTARRLGLKYSCDQLFQPQVGVRFGILYLKRIEERMPNATIKDKLSAYNAGMKYHKDLDLFTNVICKDYNLFEFTKGKFTECYPGEYINEYYVWKNYRNYKYRKSKEVADERKRQVHNYVNQ